MLGTLVSDVRTLVKDALGFTPVGYDVIRVGSHNPETHRPEISFSRKTLHENAYP